MRRLFIGWIVLGLACTAGEDVVVVQPPADSGAAARDVPRTVRDAGRDARALPDVAAIDRPETDGSALDGGAVDDVGPEDVPPADTGPYVPPTQRFACMGCPTTPFPEPGAPPCAADPAGEPTLIYPPEGVLLPPNLNVLEIQFNRGAGNTLWEVDFSNPVTDIRVTTRCSAITSVRGRATGACAFGIPQDVWDALTLVNRGRDPVTVTVRGTNDAGACATTSSVSRHIQFAFEDIEGGIYYWQSAVFGDVAGRTGGIYLHDFGTRDRTDTAFLESGTSGRCTGCHNLSRDGERMAVGQDDPDADDEFADVRTSALQVRDRTALSTALPAGFQTFTHDHAMMLASTYSSALTGNRSFGLYNGVTGALVRQVALPTPLVGTQPDWSADDRRVVFVAPRAGTISNRGDHHFHGGSLYAMDVDPMMNFGAPRMLLPANLNGADTGADATNYYPSWSPDGQFLVFNHAPSGDVFYNRNAQVWLASADGSSASALTRLNGGDGLTNSWPRWSPYVQPYGTGHILWVTFSSNRNYGVRVENDALPNCYPTASPPENTPQTTNWAMCQQPQIWMAAVGVDVDQFGHGHDTSWPAFWLPFQNVTSHNHSAQWVSRVVTRTCVMETGTCPGPGGTDCCAGLTCDAATRRCVRPCVPTTGVCPGAGGATCCSPLVCDPTTHTCGGQCVMAAGPCPGPGGSGCCAGLTCDPTTHTCAYPCVMAAGTCPGGGGAACCSGLMCDPTTHACVPQCVAEHGACPGAGGAACCGGIPCDAVTHRCERGPG